MGNIHSNLYEGHINLVLVLSYVYAYLFIFIKIHASFLSMKFMSPPVFSKDLFI